VATERSRLAQTYHRTGLEQGTVESLRQEIVELMSQHLDINAEDVHVDIDESVGPNKLVASIALRPPRRAKASPAMAGDTPARR
jgi:septum formation topological specificity factor MinE